MKMLENVSKNQCISSVGSIGCERTPRRELEIGGFQASVQVSEQLSRFSASGGQLLEYCPTPKGLTPQQKDRITQNFRAAKAIRDLKRPQTAIDGSPCSSTLSHLVWPTHRGKENCPPHESTFTGTDARNLRTRTNADDCISKVDKSWGKQSEVNVASRHQNQILGKSGVEISSCTHQELQPIKANKSGHSKMHTTSMQGVHHLCQEPTRDPLTHRAVASGNTKSVHRQRSTVCDDMDDTLLREIDEICDKRKGALEGYRNNSTNWTPPEVLSSKTLGASNNWLFLQPEGSCLKQTKPVCRPLKEDLGVCGLQQHVFDSLPSNVQLCESIRSSVRSASNDPRLDCSDPTAESICKTFRSSEIDCQSVVFHDGNFPLSSGKAVTVTAPISLECDKHKYFQMHLQNHADVVSNSPAGNSVVSSQSRIMNIALPLPSASFSEDLLLNVSLVEKQILTPIVRYTGDTTHEDCGTASSDVVSESAASNLLPTLTPNKNVHLTSQADAKDLVEQFPVVETASSTEHISLGSTASVSIVSPFKLSEQDVPVHLQRLNDAQREAATCDTSKPLLILAGPGSGKTSTIIARLLQLVQEGVQASNILAMTFTTAAATEMRERVGTAVGKAVAKEIWIGTFHSFCLQLCRTHAEKLHRTSDFLVYGHGQQRKAVIEATRIAFSEIQPVHIAVPGINESLPDIDSRGDNRANPALWKEKANKWQQFVTQAKSAGRTHLEYENLGNKIGAAILRHYESILATCNALDYHDFIRCGLELLEMHPEVLADVQNTWTCTLVDEFQDTSAVQYRFLSLLASHNRITIVGDDDQSIFAFNGANSAGFESFRQDFPAHKEVWLQQNYRSTRSIVEAASALIANNLQCCGHKQVFTENGSGEKIVIKECRTETAQCFFVVDSILMDHSVNSARNPAFRNIAVLYRRQVTGRIFQAAFRSRKIPFNVHGVAFYRKKVIKDVAAMLWTVFPGGKDMSSRRAFKALYRGDATEKKQVVEYVDKIVKVSNCDFLQAASNIFKAKVSGTFNRRQLEKGRRVLSSINMIRHLVYKEQSLSAAITAVINLLPQRPVFDSRAVLAEDGGKLLNEDDDPRSILQYFLEDVNEFLSNHINPNLRKEDDASSGYTGCSVLVKAFLDHIVAREANNFRSRRDENKDAVTLTTMHQSKGLEWDTVYIVKANDTETPLLHEGTSGNLHECSSSLEEERRLFYVAMTRARKKLHISYVVVDQHWQLLQPSRFLKELPPELLDFQVYNQRSPNAGSNSEVPSRLLPHAESNGLDIARNQVSKGKTLELNVEGGHDHPQQTGHDEQLKCPTTGNELMRKNGVDEGSPTGDPLSHLGDSTFLRGFNVEARSMVALIFHNWAKKAAFQDPERLLSKVGFVVDERLRTKCVKNKDILIGLKCSLRDEAALLYARHVVAWAKLPAEERALLQSERQEHFQLKNSERSQASSAATTKQIAYLRSLGCTVDPTSRLQASHLITQYKRL